MTPDIGRSERMVAMFQRSVPVSDIAREFGVNPPAVRKALTKAGVYAPRPRAGIATKGSAARARTRAQVDSLAEHVAEGGSITGWARDHGYADSRGFQVWSIIRTEMGVQAI